MAHHIEIMPCSLAHIRALALNLREGDRMEATASGRPCRHLLHALWRNSSIRKAATVDGQIAAAWGCCGSMMDTVGEPWLLTTPAVEKVPVSVLKIAKYELAEMAKGRNSLVSSVATEYKIAVRFVEKLGFLVGGDEHLIGPNAVSFREIRKDI